MSTPAVKDLLGVLAYGELVAFERIAADASMAPTLADKTALAAMADAEFRHYQQVSAYLSARGTDPIEAMEPFVEVLNNFHDNLAPRDWLEGLLKAYVGDGIAADFYREISVHLDESTSQLVNDVLADVGQSEFAVARLREAIELDPKVAGRLALWGRRMMGEMISQASIVATSRPALQQLFAHAATNPEAVTQLSGLVNRLTVAHSRRMDALGLAS